jgi:hypothetical protein
MPSSSDITRALDAGGPVVSAYLESPSDEENAAFHLATRWKTMRSGLAADGVDDDTLAAMDEAIGVDTAAVTPQTSPAPENAPEVELDAAADHAGGDVLAVLASQGKVLLREHLGAVRGAGHVRFGPVAWVTPLLEAIEQQVPHVVVLADRTGADLHGVGRRGEVGETVEGTEDVIHRFGGGGWSHRRFQQRAIDSWVKNAHEVAEEAQALCEQIDARLLLVGGDDHAVSYFTDALGQPWNDRVRRLEHATRAAGGDPEKLDEEVRRLVRTAVAEDEVAILERYRELCGRGEQSASGANAVVAALQSAMVDTLLLHDDLEDDRRAWFGPDANLIALDRADLSAMGAEEAGEARLIDVAVRAALGTGATCRLVPNATVDEGLGAILRA